MTAPVNKKFIKEFSPKISNTQKFKSWLGRTFCCPPSNRVVRSPAMLDVREVINPLKR